MLNSNDGARAAEPQLDLVRAAAECVQRTATEAASVQNGVLPLFSPLGPVNHRIVDVPSGGYIDSGQGQRYFLGGETFIDTFVGPVRIGHNMLTPR